MQPKILTISRDEATPEQLRHYATHFLNLELEPGEDALAAIERAQPGQTTIFALEDAPVIGNVADAAPDVVEGASMGSLGRDDPKWTVIIPVVESDDNSGKLDVMVGVNGRAWQIRRGVEVTIPHRVKVALDNAESEIVRHDDAGEVDIRKAKRFPPQVITMPRQEEIDAWFEKTKDQFCA